LYEVSHVALGHEGKEVVEEPGLGAGVAEVAGMEYGLVVALGYRLGIEAMLVGVLVALGRAAAIGGRGGTSVGTVRLGGGWGVGDWVLSAHEFRIKEHMFSWQWTDGT
jgi:hypothetical protein